MSKKSPSFRIKEIVQPSWVRFALATILSVATSTAGGTSKQHIVDHVMAHTPDHDTRARLAQYFFRSGYKAFSENKFDDSLNDFEASNRAITSLEMTNNIVIAICRSLGYSRTPMHPLQLARATGEHSEWLDMSTAELRTDPDYIRAIGAYEASVNNVDEINRATTVRLVSGSVDQRPQAMNKLRRAQAYVNANIATLKRAIWMEGLGNTQNGMPYIPAETTCDPIPNFLPAHSERFQKCNQNLISLREQEHLLTLVHEALLTLTNVRSQ